uniref:UBC core domain-containing protein n=2 Tax=Arion vulgaris TaxID=1028688 RepID=A0A0B6ZXI8_9EUPU
MDFSTVKAEAINFVDKSSNGLSIIKLDDESCQIHFSFTDGNIMFYISCPTSDGSSWNVWSDCDKSRKVLQYVMDSCNLDACSNVTEVLNSVSGKLQFASKMNTPATKNADNDECSSDEDDDEDGYDYYVEDDVDAQVDQKTAERAREEEEENKLASNFSVNSGSLTAIRRLVKDMKTIQTESVKFGIIATPKENNLFFWDVKLIDIPEDSKLGCDLAEYAKKYKTEPVLHLHMRCPPDYPFSPPFIRVVKPRFQYLTGHVTVGGSICMQMLTKSGWRPTNDIETVLVQVRAEILSDPRAALDIRNPHNEYSEDEAKLAFDRMVNTYGW